MSNQTVVDPKTGVSVTPSTVVVEDSVTHQSGDGITAGMAPSQETPDIFDNTPQAAIKTQRPSNLDDTVTDERVSRISDEDAQKLQQLAQQNTIEEASLHTLSDGSVDIARDN